MNYIFDVDGTLTPSRGRIDQDFEKFFLDFIKKHNVYLVTGSDYEKTEEQLGEEICNNVTYVFNCAGNSIRKNGTIVFENDWVLPQSARSWLLEKLDESKFYRKTGIHIEQRPGMVNFSIIGRNCNLEERAMYRQWDEHKNERNLIAKEFQEKFNLQADVAGETGIDIYPIGADKSQVIEWIEKPISFFGDKMQLGGNDYPLAKALELHVKCSSIQVKDWKDTQRMLWALENVGVHEFVGVV
tara:strand:- start:395 stop:1120 length:726 start_codon:yes stop_codon:yes gene_type:complete